MEKKKSYKKNSVPTVNGEFGLFVGLIQTNGLGKLKLRANSARITFLIYPFDSKWVNSRKSTNFTHFTNHDVIGDGGINISDENIPENKKRGKLDFYLERVTDRLSIDLVETIFPHRFFSLLLDFNCGIFSSLETLITNNSTLYHFKIMMEGSREEVSGGDAFSF